MSIPRICIKAIVFPVVAEQQFDGVNALCKHGLVNRLKNHGGLIVLAVSLLLLLSLLPLGTALEFGEDEGYQLMMGFLNSRGHALYQEIWSDQPPLFVLLLGWTFKAFGPSLLAARLLAVVFGMVMLLCFFLLLRHRLQTQAALLGTFFLLAAPGVLVLSASVMQEVPMFALVLLSVCLLFQWQRTKRLGWLLASGVVFGLAAEIKLLALLAGPAILVELILADQVGNRFSVRAGWLRTGALWAGAAVITFTTIAVIWGGGSFHTSLLAHTSEQFVPGKPTSADFPIQTKLFLNHSEVIIAAIVGTVLAVCQRRWRDFVFPMVLLITVSVVHLAHRPWWNYYYLHFAIPLAWLAGFVTSEIFKRITEQLSTSGFQMKERATWKALALCALTALTLTWSLKRLEGSVKDLRARPKVETDPVVAKMRVYADKTQWVYAENPIYAFHAKLPAPPEIAMVTLKRLWSGQITTGQIIAKCKERQVGQILIDPATSKKEWGIYLKSDFKTVFQSDKHLLSVKQKE